MRHIRTFKSLTLNLGFVLSLTTAAPAQQNETGTSISLEELRRDLAAIAEKVDERAVPFRTKTAEPGSLPVAAESLTEAVIAQAALQVAKARDFLDGSAAGMIEATKAKKAVDDARAMLALADRKPQTPPALDTYGRIKELAYFARNDGSPQPYFIYRPPGLDPDEPVPLIISLHGWVPDTSRTNPYFVPPFTLDLADKHGVMLALPHGRTNTDFQYIGEVDVLRVRAEVLKFYNIDPERIYLLGISMGGAGAWQIAAHYPDLFTGSAPINGQVDWFRFWQEHFDAPERKELPEHIEHVIAMNNPADLLVNLTNVYTYGQQALTCFVGIEHLRTAVRGLEKYGAQFDAFEDPSTMGHYIYWRQDCWERAFANLLKHRREAAPGTVRYKTYSMRYPGAFWCGIDRMERAAQPASFHAETDAVHGIKLMTENVAALTLSPPAAWADEDGGFNVAWNGREPVRHQLTDGRIHLSTDAASPELAKTTKVCGPAPDVFNFPFLAVVGTTGTPAEDKALEELAQQFAADWQAYGEGQVQVVHDNDLTDKQIQKYGLVLFGLPQTNKIIERIANELPFKLSRQTIRLPDGHEYATSEHGLLLTYPNPLAKDRYILIYNGLHYGEGRSASHRFDRLPDFVVYTDETYPGIGSNAFKAAGFFTTGWQYDPDLVDFATPAKVRQTWPEHEVPVPVSSDTTTTPPAVPGRL